MTNWRSDNASEHVQVSSSCMIVHPLQMTLSQNYRFFIVSFQGRMKFFALTFQNIFFTKFGLGNESSDKINFYFEN